MFSAGVRQNLETSSQQFIFFPEKINCKRKPEEILQLSKKWKKKKSKF